MRSEKDGIGLLAKLEYYTVLGKLTLYTMTLEEYQEQYRKAYSLLQQYTGYPASVGASIASSSPGGASPLSCGIPAGAA